MHLLLGSLWFCLSLMQDWQSWGPIALSYLWFLCNVLCPWLYILVPSGLTSLLHPQKRLQIITMTKPRDFLLYFKNDWFVLHGGASCLSLGSLATICLRPAIRSMSKDIWKLIWGGHCSFHHPCWPSWAELRLLSMQWIHDHHSDRRYLNIL